jgi:hypothetical protein
MKTAGGMPAFLLEKCCCKNSGAGSTIYLGKNV